jgi:hypothetical protein
VPSQILVSPPMFIIGIGKTTMGNIAVVAHWPAFGVNVYTPVVMLLTVVGLQVPIMPLVEIVGKIGDILPEQNGIIGINIGVVNEFIVIVFVMPVAHCPEVGVKL